MLLCDSFLPFCISSPNPPTSQIYLHIFLYKAGSCNKHLGLACGDWVLACSVTRVLPWWRVCARVGITNTRTCTHELPGSSPSGATHVPARKWAQIHTCTHTHKRVLRELPTPAYTDPPLGASSWPFLSGSGPRGWLGTWSSPRTVRPCRHSRPSPRPNAQTASWRNECLWMARASPTPETPARSASVGKAMPIASLGPAPGPPVPTRCLVPAARTTAMVRWMGWGVGGVSWDGLVPSMGF